MEQTIEQKEKIFAYSGAPIGTILNELSSRMEGLNDVEVKAKVLQYGKNAIAKKRVNPLTIVFLKKFFNPLIITLLIIATISFFLGQKLNGYILIFITIFSSVLSFIQEHKANKEAKKLSEMVKVRSTVIRNGRKQEIPIDKVVPGDILLLSAGAVIPADIRIVTSKNLFVNQSALTGESFPMEKFTCQNIQTVKTIYELPDLVFMGSNVISGTATGVVIKTGFNSELGKIADSIAECDVITDFDKGVKSFILLIVKFILILTASVFILNTITKASILESLLFSVAVAVGLTPDMFPMIVAVNLSRGAINMAKKDVIVKKLSSIQNFGAMNVLCTDKTGTLTMDKVVMLKYCDPNGEENEDVLKYAYINSLHQTGLNNLLDQAILDYGHASANKVEKIDEIPYDFKRRIMSVVVKYKNDIKLITKGAPEEIVKLCTKYEIDGKQLDLSEKYFAKLKKLYDSFSKDGLRVLAIAYRETAHKDHYSIKDERELILKGFVSFLDPVKPDAKQTVEALKKAGIELKILSGDNELVTAKICSQVGLDTSNLVIGSDIDKLNGEELDRIVNSTAVFARLDPMQKEKVVDILKRKFAVGFLGDGINDAPALKTADIGISVNNGADIAKETADIILLKKSLTVLKDCVYEGRRTFANVIKYIKMGSSSNFGNMLSIAAASVVFPFLPLTPFQILLDDFLYDLSQLAIPTDIVDKEYLESPRSWNIGFIKHFILAFGPITALFNFANFAILFSFFHGSPDIFRSGCFIEFIVTQIFVVFIIRTNKIPFIESKPSRAMLLTTISVMVLAISLTFLPTAHLLGFGRLPINFFGIILILALCYLLLMQLVKNIFVKKYGYE